jgi:hypothetical protein
VRTEKRIRFGDIIRLATIPRNNIEVYFAETSDQAQETTGG